MNLTRNQVIKFLGISEAAFYRLKDKAGVTPETDGTYSERDIIRLLNTRRLYHQCTKYRVSVRKDFYYVVKHVNLTKKRALQLIEEYALNGQRAVAISCDGLNNVIKL